MNHLLYTFSFCIALPIMFFIGIYLIAAKTPDKAIFANYIRSKRIIGSAVLLLALNYSVHFFIGIRFINVNAAILMNLSTYFLCYWLFSVALTSLLSRSYLTKERFIFHICLWVVYTLLSCVVLFLFPEGPVQKSGMAFLAALLVIYGIWLVIRLITAYRKVVRLFDDTHSDDMGAYIHWLSFFTYWACIFGVGCAVLTFLPDRYVFIWVLSSVPFYIYLFCSYMNYLLFYEQVEETLEQEENQDSSYQTNLLEDLPAGYVDIQKNLLVWVEKNGYVSPGLTLRDLADTLHTNRTYLSGYIKTMFGKTFREWITGLRMEYAKKMLTEHPERTIADVSERSGFLSSSHFMKTFKECEGCSPAKWRKNRL